MYDGIAIKLETIKYKMDITCYLFFWSSGLAIKLSH